MTAPVLDPASRDATRLPVDTPLTLLGGLSPRRFMARYWQRRPLCVRAALPPAAATDLASLDLRRLRQLAADPDIESRLVFGPAFARARAEAGAGHGDSPARPGRSAVTGPRRGAATAAGPSPASRRRGRRDSAPPAAWRLEHGPFRRLPPIASPGWTLLVQGVDLHLDAARALLDRFRFVSDARLDDLMISFASDGGGVGAHVDSYDVFLLQLDGRRRWAVAPPLPASRGRAAPAEDAGAALRHLDRFEPTLDWLLEPGDMLYLPPGWGHDGVADGPCLTASIGFRSPTPAQWLAAIHAEIEDDADATLARPFRDRDAVATDRPGEVPPMLADRLVDWQRRWQPSADQIERALGRLLTEPKPTVWFDADDGAPTDPAAFDALSLDRGTRLLYRGGRVFINGEALAAPVAARAALQRLADHRRLAASDLTRALRSDWLAATLSDWLAAGWIHGSARFTPDHPA